MTILYTDARQQKRIEAIEPSLSEQIKSLFSGIYANADQIDLVWIDLRGDVETIVVFEISKNHQIGSMGGAIAWNIYRQLAELVPAVNFHFHPHNVLFSGR